MKGGVMKIEPIKVEIKEGDHLTLRTAQPDDAQHILNYLEDVSAESDFLTFGPGEFEITLEQEIDLLTAYRESPNQLFLLGLINDELVALANVGASARPRLRHRGILGMSVRKAFWGLGIGSAILDHVLLTVRQNRFLTKLDLHVRTDHDRAIALYRSRGFVEEGLLRRQTSIGGVFYDNLAMGVEVDHE